MEPVTTGKGGYSQDLLDEHFSSSFFGATTDAATAPTIKSGFLTIMCSKMGPNPFTPVWNVAFMTLFVPQLSTTN